MFYIYTEMEGYFSKFKYWNFKKILKIDQVTLFHGSKNSIMNWVWKLNILKSFFVDVCLEKP